jgi:hypothetical protein
VPIERRDPCDDDIAVRVDYCGVCHSDLHRIRGVLRDEGDLVPVPAGATSGPAAPVAPASADRGFLCTPPCRKESTITARAQGPARIARVFPSRDTPETIN